MYRTEVISNVFTAQEKASKMESIINKLELEGWIFVNAINASWFSVVLTFKQNPVRRLTEDSKFDSKYFKDKINYVVKEVKK